MYYLPFFRCLVGLPTGPVQLVLPLGKSNTFPLLRAELFNASDTSPDLHVCQNGDRGIESHPGLRSSCSSLPSVSAAPKTGCNSFVWALTTSENNLFGSSLLFSFPPHQCWFTSPWLYVIPQMEKHRTNDFGGVCARHFAARALTYDRSGWAETQSCSTCLLWASCPLHFSFSIYVPAHNMPSHMDQKLNCKWAFSISCLSKD